METLYKHGGPGYTYRPYMSIRSDARVNGMKQSERINRENMILAQIEPELRAAAKTSPCPACKEDIEKLAQYIRDRKEGHTGITNSLRELDFINELTDIAIAVAKFIRPFTKISKVPELYEKTLHDDLESNKEMRKHLLTARAFAEEFTNVPHLEVIKDILNGFIRATEFKLSCDPYMFYLFDRVIRLGYKTHLLSATSRVIVWTKSLVDPLRHS